MSRRALRYGLPVLLLLALVPISLWFGLGAKFAMDDPMNLGGALRAGFSKLLISQVAVFQNSYRPFGALVYLTLHKFFGVDPLPYRVLLHAILALNLLLAYRAARLLSRSHVVAALAVVFGGYHPTQFNLHYETSVIYDIFCFFFYFAALNVYLTARANQRPLTLLRTLAICALYLCAMNSKEMAVSLPITLLLYELLIVRKHSLRSLAPIVALAALTVLFIIGRTTGADAIAQYNGYVPQLSLPAFLEARAHQASELLYLRQSFGTRGLLLFCAALLAGAFFVRRRYFLWAIGFFLVSALPIDFIRPLRGGANLYLPFFGYAFLFAAILHTLARHALKPARLRIVFLTLLSLAYLGKLYQSRAEMGPGWAGSQAKTWTYLQQMKAISNDIRPGERILFLQDPFDSWDLFFIAQMVTGDPNPDYSFPRMRQAPLTAEEEASYPHIITLHNNRLIRLR